MSSTFPKLWTANLISLMLSLYCYVSWALLYNVPRVARRQGSFSFTHDISIGVPRTLLLGTAITLCLVVSWASSHAINGSRSCSLDYFKAVARNSCRTFVRVRNGVSPDNNRIPQMQHDANRNGRNRRHSRTHNGSIYRHYYSRGEPTYMKLDKRFIHESQHGYIELSFSKGIYEKLKDLGNGNVTETTARLLSEHGISIDTSEREYLHNNEVSIDAGDSARRKLWKRSDHGYDSLKNMRLELESAYAQPIALIKYCCINPDHETCKNHTCI